MSASARTQGPWTIHKTGHEVIVTYGGQLAYKRWHEPHSPQEKTSSSFFCPWTGRVMLPSRDHAAA